jgi:outer membrane protein assembly factor BamB
MNARSWLLVAVLSAAPAAAADWPQWRGPNRDAKVAGFEAPGSWPKQLTKKWSVSVGDGVATPALVGDRLYTFTRQGNDEVLRCLDAADGKEQWQDKHPAVRPNGGAGTFPGPRSSPTVVDGKVITFGVDSALTCLDANTGSKVWRKDSLGEHPQFFVSSSPIVVDAAAGEKLVVAQYGSEEGGGGIVAYDLNSGKRKWLWDKDGASYGSPIVMSVDGMQVLVTPTADNVVALNPADGKQLWKTSFPAPRMTYNAATPVVDGQIVIYSGSGRDRGTKAFKFEKGGDGVTVKELWSISEPAVKFDTPVIKDGHAYGLSDRDQLFCLNIADGKPTWTTQLRGQRGYGSVVDAGEVLFALTPAGELTAFEPKPKEFKKVASYPVGTATYAYPVIAGKRVFVKDKDAVTLWEIE